MSAASISNGSLGRRSFTAGLGAAIGLFLIAPPLHAASGRKLVPVGGSVRPPAGYRALLQRKSHFTRIDPREAEDDTGLLQQLTAVNSAVNAAIEYHPGYGYDAWVTVERGFGDCDDYALTKKAALMRMGIPNLRFVLCRTSAGEFTSFWQ